MKKIVGLWVLLSACVPVFAQVDTTFIYNTSMPYGTLDLRISKSATRYYYLQEGITFSYRESAPGVKTNTFRDMTSWDSSPYLQGNLREKNGSSDLFVMNYRYLLPDNYNASYDPGYPVIIMFHGLGERGNCWEDKCYWGGTGWNPNTNNPPAPTSATHNLMNNDHNLLHGGLKHLNAVKLAGSKLPNDPTLPVNAFPGFLIFPQNLNGWAQPARIEDAIRILRLMIKKYNIDENRVYIHGLSNGGGAVFQAIKRAPWLFAAALPMSAVNNGGIINDGLTAEVGKIPLWVFQGAKDTNPTPSRTYNTIKSFREAGADIRYNLYLNLGHGTWNTAYNEPDFFSWILSKRKYNPHVYYGNPVICNTNGQGVRISFSNGFPAYQWEQDGQVIASANQSQYVANTPGTYRGRFSRKPNPSEGDWEPWSDPVVVTEISPAKPQVEVTGTTHLRGPGLVSNDANNTVILKSVPEAELYTWYRNGVALNFPNTDVNDTLRTVTLTSSSTGSNGAYTLVTSYAYCPSPPSDPVQLFFHNSAPQNMTFDAAAAGFKGVVMRSGVFLSWNDLVSNETGYEIWRKKAGTADFKFAGRTATDAISFYDGLLEPNTTYHYKLRAISKTGASNYVPSNDVTINYEITTGGDFTPPSPPQELTMTANTISSVTLAWKPAADNTGIQRYEVTYGGTTISTDTSLTTFTITGLPANTEFPVFVTAVDHAGRISQPSNQIMGSTYVLGLNYKHSTGAWIDLDDPTLVATWSDPEFTGKVNNFSLTPRTQEDFFNFHFDGYIDIPVEGDYIFRLSSDDGSRMFLDNVMIIDNDGNHSTVAVFSDTLHLTAGAHPVEVFYFDYSGGQSLSVQYKGPDLSVAFKALPDAMIRSGAYVAPVVPAMPLNLAAQGNGMQRIDVSWQNSGGEVEVYRAPAANGAFAIVGRSGSGQYADTTGLNPGATYYYKVRAVSSTGMSAFTGTVSATTTGDTEAPSVPTSLQLSSKTQTQVALTWTASTDNVKVTAYEVFAGGQLAGTTTLPAFTVTSLSPGTNYNFTVKALDASENRSAMSAPLPVTTGPSAIYYSLATGNLNEVSTWKQQVNGTGSSPVDFSTNGQFFVISNRTNTTLGGPWEISGSASKVIVSTGVTLTVDQPLTASVDLEGTATLNLNHATSPVLNKISPASTVNFNVYGFIPKNTYGHVSLSGTGTKTFDAGAIQVTGSLTVSNGLTVKGAPGNETILTVGGNFIVNGTIDPAAADNRIDLRFTENSPHTLSAGSGLGFYQITGGANAGVTVQNATPQKITLGSANGGGLALAAGATFNIGANSLHISGTGAINAQNETGRIGINGGDVKITATGAPSNLYFDASGNTLDTLLVDGPGPVTVQTPATVAGAIQIGSGVLNANGQVTLLSTATRTASIAEIGNGGAITGNVTVQHYLDASGAGWRDLSAAVSGVTVAHWQNYFPITGPFTGSSPGSAEPSMFISNGTGLTAYPFSGGSNQAAIEKGRGYAVKMNASPPFTLQSSGNPFQGNIAFSLNGGSGGEANDGWNLVGNPYASPIAWNPTGDAWISASVSHTIAVRESSTVNGQPVSRYVYYNPLLGSGTIRSGQAFWVRTYSQSPSLTITEKAKVASPVAYPAPGTAISYLVVKLQQGAVEDAAYILFTEESTDAIDNNYDALKKLNEGIFNLSTLAGNNVNVAVNSLNNSFCTKTVKLNVQNVAPGNYALGFGALEAIAGIGQVTLTDHFTGATVAVNSTPYAFAVTEDAGSYGPNRFSLTFARMQLDISTPQVQATDICGQDEAVVTIAHSQQGAEYVVINEADVIISEAGEGNGESLALALHKDKLVSGANLVRVRAGFRGCGEQLLPAQVTFQYTPDFSISVQEDASVCQGEQAMLQASGAPEGGHYQWYDENHVMLGAQTATLLTPPILAETIFYVAGVNAGGCESALKGIRVYADTLETPEIIFYNDTLFTQVDGQFQWKKDGAAIADATKPFYKPEAPGNYTVVAFAGGCSQESAVYNFSNDPACMINTTTPVAEAANACGTDVVTITVSASEPGIVYTAINGDAEVISVPKTGNGATITLELSGDVLTTGENSIRIQAAREGCTTRILASAATFQYAPPFALVAPDTISVCKGVGVKLKVSGAPEDGSYAWYDAGGVKIEGISGDEYNMGPVESATVVYAAVVHGGCESGKEAIHIVPGGLVKPVITVEDNMLVTDATGNLQWKLNGEAIEGATGALFAPLVSGTYTVVVSQGNCTQESDGLAFSVTGIDDGYATEFVLHAYPVPANSSGFRLRVQSPRPEPVSIEIVDITGRKVFTRAYGLDELSQGVPVEPVAGPLTEGVYCVIATQGKVEVRKRVVVRN